MDISGFYSIKAPHESKDTAVNAQTGGKTGLPGLNFLDFIMARIVETSGSKETEDQLLQSDNPLLDPNVDAAKMLAVNEEIREEIESWPLEGNAKLWHTLALNREALDAAIKPITDGLITTENVQAGSPRLLQALLVDDQGVQNKEMLQKLQAILAKIESLTNSPEAGGLAITNLTPEQITDLKAKVDALLNEEVNAALSDEEKKKALDGIYLGLIKLMAPTEQQVASAAIKATMQKNQAEMDAQINKLTRPARGQAQEVSAAPEGVWSGEEESASPGENNFANMLKDFSGKKTGAPETANLKNPGVKPDLSTLENWRFILTNSIFAQLPSSQVPFDEFAAHSPALSVTSLGSLTNLVTQAHSASQPHPAMQVVTATVSKAAAEGQTKNITLQLDPPELGRIEIRMSFGKDKAVKAVLVAEKPETLHMMQRDAHLLERALTDSGLSADGSSLSFEMAHEGYDFNHQGRDGGHGGYADNDNGAEEIIESTMTWQVDPDTGHMRYSILV